MGFKKFLLLIFSFGQLLSTENIDQYYCTASDNKYFDNLLNLIGSIHKSNFNNLKEIAVFNLGLTNDQKEYLNTIDKVKTHEVQLTHPDLLKQFKTTSWGKYVPGWYAWKPVVIKQALEMFPYVLWIDAGNVVLKPVDNLFAYIQQNGYFLTTIGNNEFKNKEYKISTRWQTTQYLINKFDLNSPTKKWILSQEPINASLMGIARKCIGDFIMPLYEMSKDLKNYEDEGTTPEGFGTARHDQSLLTILGYQNGLRILRQDCTQASPIYLNIDKEEVPYYQTYHSDYVSDKTNIFCSRFDHRYNNAFKNAIQYKSKDKADLVIFSYDRPMQLYALLESIEKYVKNLGDINIIYRVSNIEFNNAYDEVKTKFKNYKFYKQGTNPYSDFKTLTLNCAFNSRHDYIIFAVDDMIVKDYIDIDECVSALKETNAYAFFPRMGLHINECYMMRVKSPAPKYIKVSDDICSYKFNDGQGSWNYPNNVDMTIYKKSDIKNDLLKIDMINPEKMEINWSNLADSNKIGLFFRESKVVNIPLNKCYEQSVNRSMNLYSNDELLKKFNDGFKIDINKFYKIRNNAPHMEFTPEFVNKNKDFNYLWNLTQTKYKNIKNKFSNNDNFCNQFWSQVTQRLQNLILGDPRPDFLNDYDIHYTMVRSNFGPTQQFEEDYLTSYASLDTRNKIAEFKENHEMLSKVSKKLNCSINNLGQLFYAAKILENVKKEPKVVVEFGGGFGNLAYIFKQIIQDSTIIIFDLLELNVIQYLFLTKVLPNTKIYLHDEPINNDFAKGCIHLVPVNLLEQCNFKTDVFTSNFSLTDIPEKTRNLVLDKNLFNANLGYISGEINDNNKDLINHLKNQFKTVSCMPMHVFVDSRTFNEIIAMR